MNLLPAIVDERFLRHRLRSSSNAGIACAILAIVLAYYRYFHDRVISRDLLAIVATFIVVKYALFFWYRRTD
ncbi:MAG TPA: hypothetical protein VKH19_20095 [Gemmatimonadaceae bacterium]|nr:hypothetical protein [Gemmatimonadaceae bacterium]